MNDKMSENKNAKNVKITLWEKYLNKEIGIEFKACLYFFAILFFYCVYKIFCGIYSASIMHMSEMILLTYVVGYVQVYLLWNFDEADSVGVKEIAGIIICTGIYTFSSWIFNWFDRGTALTVGFMLYLILMYICVILIYKCRRKIDDKLLNEELTLFKTKQNSVEKNLDDNQNN